MPASANLVVPQWHRVLPPHPPWPGPPPHRPRPPLPAPEIIVEKIDARVSVAERLATTTLVFTLRNPGHRPAEAVVLAPVPSGAALRAFALEGPGSELTATLMPRDEARRIYDEIVRRLIDPGLLEFAGTGLVRSSVFPVPPQGSARARLVYEEMLPEDAGRIDYALPRTEAPGNPPPWSVELEWRLPGGAASLYCPSHQADIRTGPDGIARLRLEGRLQPGALRVSALRAAADRPALAVAAYPPEGGEDGYFMVLASPPAGGDAPAVPRELTLVLDRSGSMAGEKIDQAKAAALQVVEGLADGEAFNLITYNEAVQPLFQAPRRADPESRRLARSFIDGIRPSGGTNIHGALLEALRAPAAPGQLPVLLFLTDGLPTVGETFEKKIRAGVAAANTGGRRIFACGVGVDVNAPLLARLADDSRATTSFVLPGEDVEVKVVSLFRRLSGPLVTDPLLRAGAPGGGEDPGRVADVIPARLPDLFAGDSVVVTGRYRGAAPLEFTIRGRGRDGEVAARVTLDPAAASSAQSHVPRLWATRRIGVLTDALRDLGGDERPGGGLPPADDPRARELVGEIVKLSLRHGVLSEYTAFLAREGQPFDSRPQSNFAPAWESVQTRALPMPMRSGAGAVNQEFNSGVAKAASVLDKSNRFLDENLQPVESDATVQQLADRAFFNRQGVWTDSRLAPEAAAAATELEIGSPEFNQLVDRLVISNRQALLALPGNVLIEDQGRAYHIRKM
jgi:Ca-activated chloride channel homolog